MYVATGTRPDNIYAIYMRAMKRVYSYLKGTKNCSLVYKKSSTNLRVSTDASWDNTQDARSFRRYVLRLGAIQQCGEASNKN